MLTYFQADVILDALFLAKKFGNAEGCEQSTYEEDKLIDKAIKYLSAAISEGNMPMGQHEDDIKAAQESSEEDMTPYAMQKAYGGR